jgi:hypothetical protein
VLPRAPYEEAVRAFWSGRQAQFDKQQAGGQVDAGLRGHVTGGGHLNGLRDFIAKEFEAAGVSPSDIHRKRAGVTLPGYFRPSKQWDLVIVRDGVLIAAIELKSQVGPSFGNNVNNRSEEAIGNAVDLRRAYAAGILGPVEPWIGYVFVLEEALGSTQPVGVGNMPFEADKCFHDASYKERYCLLCQRLVSEGLYDAAWFLTAQAGPQGAISEPEDDLSWDRFSAALRDRVRTSSLR